MKLPPDSIDAHLHIFGDPEKYPARHVNPRYPIRDTWRFEDLEKMHRTFGFKQFVAVQPSAYVSDHRCLLDSLARRPRGSAWGVIMIDDSMSDAELARMHEAGIRGVKFNFQKRYGLVPTAAEFRRSISRISSLDWIVKVWLPDDLDEIEDELRLVKLPLMIDNFGVPVDYSVGPKHPMFRRMLDLIRGEGWWVMLSSGAQRSKTGDPWDDVVPFGRAMYDAAPDRAAWGTDWPHVSSTDPVDETKGMDLLRRYLPDDAALQKVLVDNPKRFYRF